MFAGFILGVISTWVVLLIMGHKHYSKQSGLKLSSPGFGAEIKKLLNEAEKIGSIKYRFKIVDKITKEQMDLMQAVDRPAASAAHSRYKNKIIGRLKELESEKADIFKSIIDDGVDPIVTIADPTTGKLIKLKMSEALAMRENTDNKFSKTDSKNPRVKVPYLRVVKDEEKTDDSEPSDPTLH